MVDTTFLSKINLIYEFLKSNSIIALISLLIVFIIIDLLYGKNKKETKRLYITIIILIMIYIILIYYKPLFNILDIYITYIVKLSYFPSIIEYFTFILITIIIQIISIKKSKKVLKNINIWIGIILELLFIINLVAMNNITIDLNSITSIYENDLLLSIFQISSIIFIIWVIINLLVFIVSLFLEKKVELPKLNEDNE